MIRRIRLPLIVHPDDPEDKHINVPYADEFDDGPSWRGRVHLDEGLSLQPDSNHPTETDYTLVQQNGNPAPIAQRHAFAVVLEVLRRFESDEVLQQPLTGPAPGLRITHPEEQVQNAFFDPKSNALRLHKYEKRDGTVFDTALSRDIVAHETGHAIIHAVAPDLADAINVESLAIHEGLSDVVAFVTAMAQESIRRKLVAGRSSDSADDILASFAQIGESFLDNDDTPWLRSLHNQRALQGGDKGMHVLTDVELLQPHTVSQVLGGALYAYIRDLTQFHLDHNGGDVDEAVRDTSNQVRRLVFRSLDTLPPGELGFGDLFANILQHDAWAHANRTAEHSILLEALDKRGIVAHPRPEDVRAARNRSGFALTERPMDWRNWLLDNREALEIHGIPGRSLRVHSRLVTKRYWSANKRSEFRTQRVTRISWDQKTQNIGIFGEHVSFHMARVGLSVVTDPTTGTIQQLVVSDAARQGPLGAAAKARGAYLDSLFRDGLFVPVYGDRDVPPWAVVSGRVDADDVLRPHNTVKLLHAAPWGMHYTP